VADRVQQQTRGDKRIRRILFDQRTRRQHQRLFDFGHRHTVVEVTQHGVHDRLGAHAVAQPGAGIGQQHIQARGVERLFHAVFDHVQSDFGHAGGFLRGAFLRALFAVQHVGTRDFVLARAHQRQFDLVLDVFDVEGAAVGRATQSAAVTWLVIASTSSRIRADAAACPPAPR